MKKGQSVKQMICYGIGEVGSQTVWYMISSYLMIFYTDILTLSTGAISMIMLVARINCLLYDLWGALHLSRIPTYHTTAAHTYIEEHYMEEDLSIQQLASLCHTGSYYFIRCFKRDYGLTPHQYLVSVRINQAKELLLCTKLPVAAVASAAGFRDASYFTRMFKKNIGCTPHAFRKNFHPDTISSL